MTNEKPGKRPFLRFLTIFLILIILVLLAGLVTIYKVALKPNVYLHGKDHVFLYIPTGGTFPGVTDSLLAGRMVLDMESFQRTATIKKYNLHVKPGRYRIENGMSNNSLVNLLRSGRQEPVMVTINNIRTKAELAGRVSRKIEADSLAILNLMNDRDFLGKFGVAPGQVFDLFIPDSYEFFWNTSAREFMERMAREQKKFWNPERQNKKIHTGLSLPQVVILASIIEKETTKDEEKPMIAGVYINRLRKGMPLQADPTVIFATGDFTIKRVLIKHLSILSPYNTYIHTGLPPGPICLPSVSSIDAVLNFAHTNNLYFCAKEDLSGYHNFAATLAEHNRNASRYQAAIQKMNIR